MKKDKKMIKMQVLELVNLLVTHSQNHPTQWMWIVFYDTSHKFLGRYVSKEYTHISDKLDKLDVESWSIVGGRELVIIVKESKRGE